MAAPNRWPGRGCCSTRGRGSGTGENRSSLIRWRAISPAVSAPTAENVNPGRHLPQRRRTRRPLRSPRYRKRRLREHGRCLLRLRRHRGARGPGPRADRDLYLVAHPPHRLIMKQQRAAFGPRPAEGDQLPPHRDSFSAERAVVPAVPRTGPRGSHPRCAAATEPQAGSVPRPASRTCASGCGCPVPWRAGSACPRPRSAGPRGARPPPRGGPR